MSRQHSAGMWAPHSPSLKIFNKVLEKRERGSFNAYDIIGLNLQELQPPQPGGKTKVQHCKQRYVSTKTWNVWPINQHKADDAQAEKSKFNTNMLGIRKLKWSGIGHFTLEDKKIGRNGVAVVINKRKLIKNDLNLSPRQANRSKPITPNITTQITEAPEWKLNKSIHHFIKQQPKKSC